MSLGVGVWNSLERWNVRECLRIRILDVFKVKLGGGGGVLGPRTRHMVRFSRVSRRLPINLAKIDSRQPADARH